MQAGKRCVRCNEINDPGRIYCIRCGKYLTARTTEQTGKQTIWGSGLSGPDPGPDQWAAGADQAPAAGRNGADERYVVLCPECGAKSPVLNGVIPLACSQCGYFFQAGLDLPVAEQDAGTDWNPDAAGPSKDKRSSDQMQSPGNGVSPPVRKKNPMPTARKDTSSLRLILLTQPGVLPETVGEHGGIVGENGTILRSIRTSQQLDIHHSSGGWYARPLKGMPYYNGSAKNVGCQFRLEDGSTIIMEREQIRVEIV